MQAAFQSADVVLNLTWIVVTLAVLLCWRSEWTQEHWRAVVAVLCALVLLFPAISTADDIAEVAMTYDASPSSLPLKSAIEYKQVIAPALLTCRLGHGPAQPLQPAFGDSLDSESTGGCGFLALSSSSGIHSPPQF